MTSRRDPVAIHVDHPNSDASGVAPTALDRHRPVTQHQQHAGRRKQPTTDWPNKRRSMQPDFSRLARHSCLRSRFNFSVKSASAAEIRQTTCRSSLSTVHDYMYMYVSSVHCGCTHLQVYVSQFSYMNVYMYTAVIFLCCRFSTEVDVCSNTSTPLGNFICNDQNAEIFCTLGLIMRLLKVEQASYSIQYTHCILYTSYNIPTLFELNSL